ncbi:MAG TPA: very short patch repair endonuclease [Microvirga sp.]|nr:very short patch repair endonuclease [Microvirga sp.]
MASLRDLTPDERSARMATIPSKDTKAELCVRQVAHRLGYRFRLHRRDLPGSPDLVFPRHRKVIFVHGCFWHQHDCKPRVPKTNQTYWAKKFRRNIERDKTACDALRQLGWSVLVIWECEIRDKRALERRIMDFLTRS